MGGSLASAQSLFLLTSVGFGIALSLAAFLRDGNRAANRVLGTLVLCVTLIVFHYALLWTGVARHFPHVFGAAWPLWFLIGPLYYLYVRRLVRPARRNIGFAVHLFPALLSVVYFWSFYALPAATKATYLGKIFDGETPLEAGDYAILTARILHMGFYVYLATRELREFTGEYKRRASSDEIVSLELFRWITIPFIAYLGLAIADEIVLYFFEEGRLALDYLNVAALTGFMVALGYVDMRQSRFLYEALEPSSEKYRKAKLPDTQARDCVERLKHVMEVDRPYLRGDLRLYDLASALGLSSHHLSQLLNQSLETSFYDFVNQYRVEYAKQRLQEPESRDYTLVTIAHEVGFSNKASFNRAFKKLTGMTPSQYQSRAQRGDAPAVG